MNQTVVVNETVQVGRWRVHRDESRLYSGQETRLVEPKVMDLLFILASKPNEVFSRDGLMSALWPDTTVGDDALARCVFKLRKALEDAEHGSPRIETIPKRGYRLLIDIPAPVTVKPGQASRRSVFTSRRGFGGLAACLLIAIASGGAMWWREHSAKDREDAMLGRAGDIYFQYRRSDNQAAIVLYQRALSSDPRSAKAMAGLSSALTQRALRWPEGQDVTPATGSALGAALRSGQLHRPGPAADVRRALALAREAQARDSRDPTVLRSLGLALSASGRLIEAAQVYDRILEFAPDDWGVLINRADLHDLAGREDLALPLLERAYDNMDRAYRHEPARVLPWQAKLGVEIARRYQRVGNLTSAEQWYRRTLSDDPSSQTALADLAELGSRRERDQIDPNRQPVREAASPTP